jgi:nucleoside-diphosphate-sugar epimerase
MKLWKSFSSKNCPEQCSLHHQILEVYRNMKILVTGGIGNIGLVVSTYLLARGYEVRIIDHIDPEEIEADVAEEIQNAEYRKVDIRNFKAIQDSCEGIDLIVHLAAIPHPMGGQATEIFDINVGGTFNIYQAAADLGIKRVISASSINFLGNGFGKRRIKIMYFPIDEEHPGLATDVYAFSKQAVEHIAAYFWERDQITSACMRFPFVYNPRQFPPDRRDQYLKGNHESFDQLMALPEDERKVTARKLLDLHLEIRKKRMRGEISFPEMLETYSRYPGGLLMFGQDDFWTFLHVRDTALSIERAILADYEGCQPFYIAAPDNVLRLPTRTLAELFFPEVTTWKRDIQDTQTLLNSEKAKLVLGFEASSDL